MASFNDKITISEDWLKACGQENRIGHLWTIDKVQLMPNPDEFLYHVTDDTDGYSWVVWSIRGVVRV